MHLSVAPTLLRAYLGVHDCASLVFGRAFPADGSLLPRGGSRLPFNKLCYLRLIGSTFLTVSVLFLPASLELELIAVKKRLRHVLYRDILQFLTIVSSLPHNMPKIFVMRRGV